jgi:hypothetical protein
VLLMLRKALRTDIPDKGSKYADDQYEIDNDIVVN